MSVSAEEKRGSGHVERARRPLRFSRWYAATAAAGVLATAALLGIYSVESGELEQEAAADRAGKASEVADGIEPYLVIASQLSRTTARLVAPLRGDKARVESVIAQVLSSAPRETIYGVGAWFEPYVFAPDEKYFGPYAHQAEQPGAPPVLTYEWTTPGYDFHTQGWYTAGMVAGGRTVFTEPYFDTDQVYMSASTAFFDGAGNFTGVVTVDMVLPLLREFVLRFGGTPSEIIYVTTAKGAVFVHPEEAAFVAFARGASPQKRIASVLDLDEEELAAYERSRGRASWPSVKHPVAQVGWTVHVATSPAALSAGVGQLKRDLSFAGAGVWFVILGAIGAVHVFGRKLAKARLERERLVEEIAERRAAEAVLAENKRILEEAVRARTEELDRLNIGKDRIISVLAHDMRGFFSAIMGCSQLLSMSGEKLDRETASLLATLDSAVKQAHALFENLLLWIRLHSDRMEFSLSDTTMTGVVAKVVETLAEVAKLKGVELRAKIDGDPRAAADATMIETVIRNLCSNSLKYTPSGGRVVVAVTAPETSGHVVEVSVEDTGIGMPAEQAERLFDLERVSSTPGLDGVKGTGLGLQICREIVDKHGGRIRAESATGKGMCVHFTLRRAGGGAGADVDPKLKRA